MILVFPMHDAPCMDIHAGSPSLFDLLRPIVGDVTITWRKARPAERPGYVAGVKGRPAKPRSPWNPLSKPVPEVKAVAEVVPPPMYVLEVDAKLAEEAVANIRAAVAAWNPWSTP